MICRAPLIKASLYIEGDKVNDGRMNDIMGVMSASDSLNLWIYETEFIETYDADDVFCIMTKTFKDKGQVIGKLIEDMNYKARVIVEFHSVLYERPLIDISKEFIRLFYEMNIEEISYSPVISLPRTACKKCEASLKRYEKQSFENSSGIESKVRMKLNIAKETLCFDELENILGICSNETKMKKEDWPESVKKAGFASDVWSYVIETSKVIDTAEALEVWLDVFKGKEAALDSLFKGGAEIWFVIVIYAKLYRVPAIRLTRKFIAFMYKIGIREIGFDPYIDMPLSECGQCDLFS